MTQINEDKIMADLVKTDHLLDDYENNLKMVQEILGKLYRGKELLQSSDSHELTERMIEHYSTIEASYKSLINDMQKTQGVIKLELNKKGD